MHRLLAGAGASLAAVGAWVLAHPATMTAVQGVVGGKTGVLVGTGVGILAAMHGDSPLKKKKRAAR